MGRIVIQCDVCRGEIEPQRDASGTIFREGGHNPDPLTVDVRGNPLPADARCCDACNVDVVIARFHALKERKGAVG